MRLGSTNNPSPNRNPKQVRISQDEAGSRGVVEDQLGRLGKVGDTRLILDRCNGEPAERAYMRELAMLPRDARTACIFFDVPAAGKG